jgi:hypothetical protein
MSEYAEMTAERERTPIEIATNALAQAHERLNGQVLKLAERLTPVLRPPSLDSPDREASMVRPISAPLINELDAACSITETITARVSDLNERLAL